jgi:MFS superfamily sulfate permease-like transporter
VGGARPRVTRVRVDRRLELLDPSGVASVGHIDSGLPSVGLPDASFDDYLALAGSAVGIALVGFAEGLDIGQVRDVLRDEDGRLYPTVEDAVRQAR